MDEYENLEIIVDQRNAYKYHPNYTIPESLCYFVKNSADDVKIIIPKIIDAIIAEKPKNLLENH
jgi:hypothetical protein